MFNQAWKKYLTVIAILLRRSVNGEQILNMNPSDFERSVGGRKIKFSFSNLQLNKGRVSTTYKHTPLARELAQLMQEDEQIKAILRNQDFEFWMTSDFKLSIRNNTIPVTETEETDEALVTESDAAGQ